MDSTKKLEILLTAKDKASASLRSFGASVAKIGKVAAVAGAALAAAFSVKAIKNAIDLGESINAVEKTFGKASEKILEFGKTADKQAGLSKAAFNKAVVPIGAMLQNMGISAEKAADESINLGKRAADLASVFNTDLDTALTAIQAGLRGEADPLEKFGVGLKQSAVEAYALEKGLIASGEQMDDTARATAALGLFMKQTSKFQGDFVDTSDQAANKQRILEARFENMSAVIGQKLLPVWDKLLDIGSVMVNSYLPKLEGYIDNVVVKFNELRPSIENVVTAVAEFLLPKLEALWNTIQQDLIPVLSMLWEKYLKDLVQILGVALVGAVGLVIDALNLAISVFSSLANWFSENTPLVYGFVAALGVLKGAMVFNAVVNAIIIQFNLLKLVHIPSLIASFTALKLAIMTPIVMPAIIVAAAVASIAFMKRKVEELNQQARSARDMASNAQDDFISSVHKARDEGRITRTEAARRLSEYDKQRAHGGAVTAGTPYTVGERGQETFVPNQSGRIIKNMDTERAGSQMTVTIGNITITTPEASDRFFKQLNRSDKFTSMGLTGASQ